MSSSQRPNFAGCRPTPCQSCDCTRALMTRQARFQKGCCIGVGEATRTLPAVCAWHAALPHWHQNSGGRHVAAPGHLHRLESGHPPLWPPQHGGQTAAHSPLLTGAIMEKSLLCTSQAWKRVLSSPSAVLPLHSTHLIALSISLTRLRWRDVLWAGAGGMAGDVPLC